MDTTVEDGDKKQGKKATTAKAKTSDAAVAKPRGRKAEKNEE